MLKLSIFASVLLLAGAASVSAHCDSIDGPVVGAARRAVASGDVTAVMSWIQPQHEAEIREAFARTLSARKLGPEAAGVADTWFFETVVRIHRAGENAPYTGLKPAGTDPGPAVALADTAISSGSDAELVRQLAAAAAASVHKRFLRIEQTRGYKPSDVAAGRQYVAAYVDFVHFVERLHEATAVSADTHVHQH